MSESAFTAQLEGLVHLGRVRTALEREPADELDLLFLQIKEARSSVLERHLGYRGSWPFLVGAMYVGASRLVDNKHFLSDVVFGAAVGTASGWTVVGRGGPNEIQVAPRPVDHGLMIEFSRVPHAR